MNQQITPHVTKFGTNTEIPDMAPEQGSVSILRPATELGELA
jgi:hypothetical protein